jgi:TatD DNase family protein
VRWIDDHCHLGHLDDPDAALEDAATAGVIRVIDVGTDVTDSREAAERATRRDGVWSTAGVHPHEARAGIEGLEGLLDHPSVVAVGECGLDYHYDHSPRDDQRAAFEAQIDLALRHDLALVIHTREAWDDTFSILGATGVPDRTVFHCFTGGPHEADRALALGAHLSFSGILTFPSADDLRAAAARCPLERLLVETDAPFLTPVPHRGRPNRPALVTLVGRAAADAGGHAVEEVAEATWANATRVYDLDP